MRRADRVEEALDPERVRVGEGAGVAHVPADRLAAVRVADRAAGAPMSSSASSQETRSKLAVRACGAAGAGRGRGRSGRRSSRCPSGRRSRPTAGVVVGPQLRHLPVLDRGDHPAERLADPAVGDLLLVLNGLSAGHSVLPLGDLIASSRRAPRARDPAARAAIRSEECAATAASSSSRRSPSRGGRPAAAAKARSRPRCPTGSDAAERHEPRLRRLPARLDAPGAARPTEARDPAADARRPRPTGPVADSSG